MKKKLNKKGCFACHKEVEPENYAVHYAFGAIICSPSCLVIVEEATQKALMEQIQENLAKSEVYGKEVNN